MLTWTTAIDEWRTQLLAVGQSGGTIRLRQHYVSRFGRTVPRPQFATREDVLAWLAAHSHWSPETRKSARDALVAFYAWYHAAGAILENPAADLPSITVPPAEPRPANARDVAAALRTVREDDPRVWLMLMLGAVSGMRRAEIAAAHTDDLRGDVLLVHGKGRRRRQLVCPAPIVRAVAEIGEQGSGPLFPNPLTGLPLTPGTVGKLMSRALPLGTTPHQLRHLAASDLRRRGVTIDVVQRFLGHATITTTMRYTQVPLDELPGASAAAAGDLLSAS